MAVREEIRQQLVALARNPRRRRHVFTSARPTRWLPHTAEQPESGLPFDHPTAWNLIADRIEGGQEIRKVTLRRPEGATAYVMKMRLVANRPLLYVKVELCFGEILGRSFHHSEI